MTLDELIEKLTQMRDKEGGDTIVVRGYEKWWEGRYDDSARFAGVEGTDPVHLVHLVSATDKTFD